MAVESKVETTAAEDKRFCFVISPIGGKGSATRRRADGVLNQIIRPALEPQSYRVERADHDKSPGIVTESIITKILVADLVVADLTELNPNVMYELAIRHVVAKPVIQILEEGQELPFDIHSQNTIHFVADLAGRADAIRMIEAAEKALRGAADLGNPIKRTVELAALKASNKAEDKIVVQALADFQNELAAMRRELQTVRSLVNVPKVPALPWLPTLSDFLQTRTEFTEPLGHEPTNKRAREELLQALEKTLEGGEKK